jgi:hypothetical protein
MAHTSLKNQIIAPIPGTRLNDGVDEDLTDRRNRLISFIYAKQFIQLIFSIQHPLTFENPSEQAGCPNETYLLADKVFSCNSYDQNL